MYSSLANGTLPYDEFSDIVKKMAVHSGMFSWLRQCDILTDLYLSIALTVLVLGVQHPFRGLLDGSEEQRLIVETELGDGSCVVCVFHISLVVVVIAYRTWYETTQRYTDCMAESP